VVLEQTSRRLGYLSAAAETAAAAPAAAAYGGKVNVAEQNTHACFSL
jgi:hypothetical protein